MPKKSKVFHAPQTGSKPNRNMMVQKGSNNKLRKHKNNSNSEEGNSLSGEQPACNSCMKSKCNNGKTDWERKDLVSTRTSHETEDPSWWYIGLNVWINQFELLTIFF